MARRPVLVIDGVTYPNVHSVSFDMYTPYDDTCRPTDRPHAKAIAIVREMDSSSPVIAQWAADKEGTSRKAGSISLRDSDDADMLTISWTNGFIANYRCEVPNISTRANEQPFEAFDILFQTVTIGDTTIDNYWKA
jgi:hypothetical protein